MLLIKLYSLVGSCIVCVVLAETDSSLLSYRKMSGQFSKWFLSGLLCKPCVELVVKLSAFPIG